MNKETNIFLVRHGETEWNQAHRLQGNQDSALTSRGIEQALEVKNFLDPVRLDLAYTSPLKRARDTAELILQGRKLDVVIAENLREINLGPWEGKTRKETELSHPKEFKAFWKQPDLFSLTGADTYHQLQARVVEELESIFTRGEGRNSLVVSHWIAIKVALAHYASVALANLSDISDPQNGGISRLSMHRGKVVIHYS